MRDLFPNFIYKKPQKTLSSLPTASWGSTNYAWLGNIFPAYSTGAASKMRSR